VVLLAVAAYAVAQYLTTCPGPARCTAGNPDSRAGTRYAVTPDQAANAATIAAVGARHRLPERAVEIALATAFQESGLRNITLGDRDSLGLFQQRPSQGWGTAAQVSDPVYSSGKFYARLVRIPGYSRLPLTVAAQRVQRSGYPEAYSKHEGQAVRLAAALSGRRAAAFSCTTGPDGVGRKAGSPQAVRERLLREFGPGVLPARAQRASAPGSASGADKSRSAREIRIPARVERRGWQLAHWAVANSAGLRITRVSYENRVWNASSSPHGWHTDPDGTVDSDATKGTTDSGATAVTLLLAKGQ
jgi:hypothetical protein